MVIVTCDMGEGERRVISKRNVARGRDVTTQRQHMLRGLSSCDEGVGGSEGINRANPNDSRELDERK